MLERKAGTVRSDPAAAGRQAESAAGAQRQTWGRRLRSFPAQLRSQFTRGRCARLPRAQLKYCLAQPGNAT